MKKFQIALMCIATLAFIACKPNNNPEDPTNGDDDDEYVAPITVDGDAADWAKLGDKVFTADCNKDAEFKALTTMKVYADELFIYLYAEYDASLIDINEDMSNEEFAEKWGVPFHIYINATNSNNGFIGQWSTPATMLTEGFLFLEGKPIEYNPSAFIWAGEVASTEWTWDSSSATNYINASKVTDKTIEMSILREALPETIGDEFRMGIDIQKAWDSQGILPNMEKNEEGTVAEMLLVKTDKK